VLLPECLIACGCVFFQAEDGIRYFHVTGVQTCALPIFAIQLLNAAPGDADLLFAPELHARIPEVTSSARYFSTPSPGVLNDPGSATPGPLIIEVTATPNPPAPDEDIVITARLRPTLHPIASVEL